MIIRVDLLQWSCFDKSGGDVGAVFTPVKCDETTALAVATATIGRVVARVENDGEITQRVEEAKEGL